MEEIIKEYKIHILGGLVILGLAYQLFSPSDKNTLGFSESLPKGTRLEARHITLISGAPRTDQFSREQFADPIGATLMADAKKSEPLGRANLRLPYQKAGLAEFIPKGLRAYTIVFSQIPPLRKNDLVDVLQKGKAAGVASIVEKVKVLDIRVFDSGYEVTLILSPQEIEFLERCREKGKMFLVIRNPEENEKKRPKALTQPTRTSVRLWVEAP